MATGIATAGQAETAKVFNSGHSMAISYKHKQSVREIPGDQGAVGIACVLTLTVESSIERQQDASSWRRFGQRLSNDTMPSAGMAT